MIASPRKLGAQSECKVGLGSRCDIANGLKRRQDSGDVSHDSSKSNFAGWAF